MGGIRKSDASGGGYSVSPSARFLSVALGASGSLLLLGATSGYSDTVIAPPEAISNDNGNAIFQPFDTPVNALRPRVCNRFANRPPSNPFWETVGGWVTAILFRVDASAGHPFTATMHNFQLNLSTTQRSPDDLSTVFSQNVGSDDALVMEPQSLQLFSNGEEERQLLMSYLTFVKPPSFTIPPVATC